MLSVKNLERYNMPKISNKGFTLVELMIIVAIIGILVAVAYPSYNTYTQKVRRNDARDALLLLAANQERFYAVNNGYTKLIADIGGSETEHGYYELSVTTNGANDNDGTTYTVTATAIGSQVADPVCGAGNDMELNSAGQKTPPECWR